MGILKYLILALAVSQVVGETETVETTETTGGPANTETTKTTKTITTTTTTDDGTTATTEKTGNKVTSGTTLTTGTSGTGETIETKFVPAKEIAAQLLKDFEEYADLTKKSMSNLLIQVKKNIVNLCIRDPDPYNAVVDAINDFIKTLVKSLQDFEYKSIRVINRAHTLVVNEKKKFTVAKADQIIEDFKKQCNYIIRLLENLPIYIATLTREDFIKLLKKLKFDGIGHVKEDLKQVKFDKYFDDYYSKILGDSTSGLKRFDNDIESLQTPIVLPPHPPVPHPTTKKNKHCGIFCFVAKAVGSAVGNAVGVVKTIVK